MRAIPRQLLIHTVIHSRKASEDAWGKESYGEETALTFVRMEPSAKVVRDKNGAEVQLSAVLFWDCRNSRPEGFSFRLDDVIVFRGQKHKVITIDPLYDGRRLHHIELGVVAHA